MVKLVEFVDEEITEEPAAPGGAPKLVEFVPPRAPEDTFGDDFIDVLAQFAQSVNSSIPALLDMPSHAVNFIAEKSGSDFRIPANMLDKWNAFNFENPQNPNYMEPGWPRKIVDAGGTAASFAMGVTPVARAPSVRSAVEELAGIGSTTATAAGRVVAPELGATLDAPKPPSVTRRTPAEEAIMSGSGDAAGAGYRFNPQTLRVEKYDKAKKVIDQGIDVGTVAMLKESNRATKDNVIEMLGIKRRGKENKKFHALNRPSDVIGRAVENRLGVIRNANQRAGKDIDNIAETQLRGQYVDFTPAMREFYDSIKAMKIDYDPATRQFDFSKSHIRGMTGLENAFSRVLEQLKGMPNPSAYDLHIMKRILDEQLTYGKAAEGLSGNVERTLKNLRRGLDKVLDTNFPEYDQANLTYAETIDALDDMQALAGQKYDLTGPSAAKALGLMSRKLLSNYQVGAGMEEQFSRLDALAKKYNAPPGKQVGRYRGDSALPSPMASGAPVNLDDDLVEQIVVASELDKYFGSSADNSLLGNLEKAANPLMRAAVTGDVTEVKVGTMRALLNKYKGINEDAAMKALEDLLKE